MAPRLASVEGVAQGLLRCQTRGAQTQPRWNRAALPPLSGVLGAIVSGVRIAFLLAHQRDQDHKLVRKMDALHAPPQ